MSGTPSRDDRYRRKLPRPLSSATFFEGYDTFVLSFLLALVLSISAAPRQLASRIATHRTRHPKRSCPAGVTSTRASSNVIEVAGAGTPRGDTCDEGTWFVPFRVVRLDGSQFRSIACVTAPA
jgi:hypothetical protein